MQIEILHAKEGPLVIELNEIPQCKCIPWTRSTSTSTCYNCGQPLEAISFSINDLNFKSFGQVSRATRWNDSEFAELFELVDIFQVCEAILLTLEVLHINNLISSEFMRLMIVLRFMLLIVIRTCSAKLQRWSHVRTDMILRCVLRKDGL